MTNKLVVIINSLKVHKKIKKILLYEMKFLVPNYSCLQKSWLGGYRPQIPFSLSSVLNWICWNPPEQTSWVRHRLSLCSTNDGIRIGWCIQNCRRHGASCLVDTLLLSLEHIRVWMLSTTYRQRVSQCKRKSSNMQAVCKEAVCVWRDYLLTTGLCSAHNKVLYRRDT